MISFAACVVATYSASVVDRVTSSCFFNDHETAPLSIRMTKPEIAHLCSRDAPSASVNTIIHLVALHKSTSNPSSLSGSKIHVSLPPSEPIPDFPNTAIGHQQQT